MSTILNNLYPPLVPSVAPAQLLSNPQNTNFKLYFSLSPYNKIQDILNIQYTIVDVETNLSKLNPIIYPSGIKITDYYIDPTIDNDYKYYIIINGYNDLMGNFEINKYYKIQLRFTSISASMTIDNEPFSTSDYQPIASWLNENLPYFSEWSKGCLVRCVTPPIIQFDIFGIKGNNPTMNETTPVEINHTLSEIIGELSHGNINETDELKEYQIKFYLKSQPRVDSLVYDSGILYPKEKNQFYCKIPYNFDLNKTYIMTLNYTTTCLYSSSKSYEFFIGSLTNNIKTSILNIIPSVSVNQDEGYINLHFNIIKKENLQTKEESIIIRRASSKTNFKIWEDLCIIDYLVDDLDWEDITVENGIFYKYGIFLQLSYFDISDNLWKNNRILTIITQPIMLSMLEDSYLIKNDLQLKLAFNLLISNFKYNLLESQHITLGSKYPYLKRNGNTYYRSFNISGLISSLMDINIYNNNFIIEENNENQNINNKNTVFMHPTFFNHKKEKHFSSKEKLYGDSYELYIAEENKNNFSEYLNLIYEKIFREAIYDFFYADDIKLFKSPTQGNILIKLTDISFEPVKQLGRILYSFSATAIEVDEPTLENYIKYKIISNKIYSLTTFSPILSDSDFGLYYKNQFEEIIKTSKKDKNRTYGKYSNIALTINADGIEQDPNSINKWILYAESHQYDGGILQ